MNVHRGKNGADFYVSPEGSDEGPGTRKRPFATPQRAVEAVEDALDSEQRSFSVNFRDGTYYLDSTVDFYLEDSAPEGFEVTFRAQPGENPVFSGGVPVEDWKKLSRREEPDHLPPAASGKVWAAPVPDAALGAKAMFAGFRRLSRARGDGFAIWEDESIPTEDRYHRFRAPDGVIQPWPDLRSADLVVIPMRKWKMNILPLKNVDPDTGQVETDGAASYPLWPNNARQSAWVENTLAVLDSPGEWVLDVSEKRVYYWPENDRPEENIVLAALTELIFLGGEVDEEGETDLPVKGINLEAITFAHNNRYLFYGRTGWGMQHDWEAWDSPTAMVRLRSAENCAVRNCRFVAGDGAGVRLDLHAQKNVIEGNTIERLGGAGVVAAGYGPGTKDVNRDNIIRNNDIHHIGLSHWHAPGIFIWQSGHNRIVHNHVHHTPYTGIVLSGRINLRRDPTSECSKTIRWDEVERVLGADYETGAWHDPERWKGDWELREPLLHGRHNLIEKNDIHHVMLVLNDGNGIYISGAGRGNVARGNVVHDSPSGTFSEGIRCDDDQHETVIDANIIYGLGGKANGITIKGVNTITNNIVAAPVRPHLMRGLISLGVGPLHGTVVRNNILYATHPDHEFFFEGRVHGEGPPGRLRDCDADGNLYWNAADPAVAEKHLKEQQGYGVEKNSIAADPLFEASRNNDYRVRKDSPAHKLGIEPGDPEEAGPTRLED